MRLHRQAVGLGALLMASWLGGGTAMAAELANLYQAKVPVSTSSQAWQQQALANVLTRVTGSEAVLANPTIAAELRRSSNYLVQYQRQMEQGQPLYLVTFDAAKVSALLQAQQIPQWGARRPDVLVWLTERLQDVPSFMLRPEHPLRVALQTQADRFGLSFKWPLFDVDDLALLNEQAAWAGDWTAIQAASSRYQADEVENLLFDQYTDATGAIVFRLTSQRQVENELVTDEWVDVDAMALASRYCAAVAARQSAKYAVLIQANQATESSIRLTIHGVESFEDVAKVQQLFGSMLTVGNVELQQYQVGSAQVLLQLRASRAEFYQAMSLVKQFQGQAAPVEEDSQAMTAAEPTATENASVAMDSQADGSAPAETPAEDGLAQDQQLAELLQDPKDLQLPSTSSDATSPVAVPAITEFSHYLFVRR